MTFIPHQLARLHGERLQTEAADRRRILAVKGLRRTERELAAARARVAAAQDAASEAARQADSFA